MLRSRPRKPAEQMETETEEPAEQMETEVKVEEEEVEEVEEKVEASDPPNWGTTRSSRSSFPSLPRTT